MKFGIEFVPEIPIPKIVSLVKLAEVSGFQYVWITDHYNNRNVYITLASIATQTDQIYLGPGVTNPVLISPAWTASALLTLNEVSNGRAVLGIGPGDKATFGKLGFGFKKPLTRMRESIQAIRSLMNGKAANFEGKVLSFSKAKLNFKTQIHSCGTLLNKKEYKAAKKGKEIACNVCNRPLNISDIKTGGVPIYAGAQGPKMLALAGEIADGVLINAAHPKDFEFAIDRIKIGAEKANRSLDEIDIAAYASFSAHTDENEAKKAAAIVVAFIVAGSPSNVLERHQIPAPDAEVVSSALAAGDFGKAMNSITPAMFDAFTIAGNAEQCIERIKGLEKIGVTQVVIGSPVGPKKKDAINYIADKVLPIFK
ncbi:MAG: 5,10-methylenetetrahydromethanopterin reductase [Promethearchaeota archaeon]